MASRVAPLELLPTQTGWFADEDIFEMSIADYSPHATARRFDSGTPPVPSLYPGVAGMGLIAEVGVPSDRGAHPRASTERLLAGLDELGATVVDAARRARVRAAHLRRLDRIRTRSSLRWRQRQIVTSTRDSNLRISLHLYNVEEDVDRILDALASHRHLLA